MSRVTSKGQVTIPAAIRVEFGFHPDTDVEFVVQDGVVRLQHATRPELSRGERLVARLRGRAGTDLSTDEILALTRPE